MIDEQHRVVIRPEHGDDSDEVAAIDAMLESTFAGQTVQRSLVAAMRQSAEYRQRSTLVALHGETIVGFTMVSTAWLEDSRGRRVITSLAPLGVLAEYRDRGIGGALLDAAAAAAQADGSPMLVLEGPPAYYVRHGFEPGPPLGIVSHLTERLGESSPLVRRLSGYLESMAGLVIYPDVFAQTRPNPDAG